MHNPFIYQVFGDRNLLDVPREKFITTYALRIIESMYADRGISLSELIIEPKKKSPKTTVSEKEVTLLKGNLFNFLLLPCEIHVM